jgi:hypothetical protein
MPVDLFGPGNQSFAGNGSPIEAEVGMRVLERFHDLGVERRAADL